MSSTNLYFLFQDDNPSDLIKSTRDTSKLVKVRRVVTRNGKTFTQDYYVSPNQVKKTDVVIGNSQNVLPKKGSVPYPGDGVWNQKYFDSISQEKSSRAEALKYIDTFGLNYRKTNNEAITWMWALNALKSHVGFDLLANAKGISTQKPSSSPSNIPQNASSNNQPGNTSPQSSKQAKNAISPGLQELGELILKNSALAEDMKAAKNGKEKVIALKKHLGQKETIELAEKLGISVKPTTSQGIYNMRISMAMAGYFDKSSGTIPPKAKKVKTPGKVGAPEGNDNAKKDSVVDDQNSSDPNKIDIPKDATQRQKNLINLINNITDLEELDLISETGLILENADDISKEFVYKRMWDTYKSQIGNREQRENGGNENLHVTFEDELKANELISKNMVKVCSGLSIQVLNKVRFTTNNLSLSNYVAPREKILLKPSDRNNVLDVYDSSNIFTKFSNRIQEFNTYAQGGLGEDNSLSNVGYLGDNLEESAKLYDRSKEGFIHIMEHIGKTQPDLKDETNKMSDSWDKLMKKVKGNKALLNQILAQNYSIFLETKKAVADRMYFLGYLKEALDKIDDPVLTQEEKDYNILLAIQGELNFYRGVPYVTYTDGSTWHNSLHKKVSIPVPNVPPDKGTSPFGTKFDIELFSEGIILTEEDAKKVLEGKPLALEEVTSEVYDFVHNTMMEIWGVNRVDKFSDTKVTSKPHEWGNSLINSTVLAPSSKSTEKDGVISNLRHIMTSNDFLTEIAKEINYSSNSKVNEYGKNFSNQFNYHSMDTLRILKGYDMEGQRRGNKSLIPISSSITNGSKETKPNPVFESAEGENATVLKQLHSMKTYSVDYLTKLRNYVDAEGNADFQKPALGYSEQERKALSLDLASNYKGMSGKRKNLEEILNSNKGDTNPAFDLLRDRVETIALFCPQNFTKTTDTAEKVKNKVHEVFGKNTYDFSATQDSVPQDSAFTLKRAREKAAKYANCSLVRVDESTQKEVTHNIKMNFDKVDANGNRVPKSQRIYDDRSLVFHSGVYEVKNSSFEKAFNKRQKETNEKPIVSYHGTGYTGATGILGVDGAFRYEPTDRAKGQKNCGSMLGYGIYSANLVGKCCPYIGSDNYGKTSTDMNPDYYTPNYAQDGVLVIMDTLLGKYGEFSSYQEGKRNNKNNGGTYDTVAMKAGASMAGGTKLKEYERVVTDNSQILPKYIVDIGYRVR